MTKPARSRLRPLSGLPPGLPQALHTGLHADLRAGLRAGLRDCRLTMPPLRRPRLWLACAMLAVGWVALGSVMQTAPLPRFIAVHDKLVHVVAYASLMVLLTQFIVDRRGWIVAGLALVLVGVGVECVQAFVPTRRFELLDMLCNTAGVALAWMVLRRRSGNLLLAFERWCLREARLTG